MFVPLLIGTFAFLLLVYLLIAILTLLFLILRFYRWFFKMKLEVTLVTILPWFTKLDKITIRSQTRGRNAIFSCSVASIFIYDV